MTQSSVLIPQSSDTNERLRRWRLVLGGAAECCGAGLSGDDARIDGALAALYDSERSGGLGGSNPSIARWLGDIRSYFPASVVQVMQRDALERLNLRQMLLEPELLQAVEPNVHLVADLLALKSVMPAKTLDTARQVVRRVVDELQRKLANPTRQAVLGSEEARARILSRTPMKRLGEPGEVADVAAFLLSSASSYMTGEIVYIDGGRLCLNYTVQP